MYNTRYCL